MLAAALVLTATRRWTVAGRVVRATPWVCIAAGLAAVLAYAFVLAAVRRAPVGYVTALRESSVVLGAFAGWRILHEPPGAARVVSSCVVLSRAGAADRRVVAVSRRDPSTDQ